ncbi:MAG: copper homeostasis protein CutC [Stenotrophomonas sp.]|uniref:copper homeostasis protein CutC n=1 Tax=Stenotrophomonas sp. TaxID=69392 RepID=UPI003D6D821D
MSTPFLLEIACNSAASALAAAQGGADRVELFENLEQGGTTPSYGTLAVTRDKVKLPLFVLIRPRPGDFFYDTLERDLMLRDIEMCRRLGCDGVVIGALDADGNIDLPLCRELVATAGPLGLTFHRAFDAARDLPAALEDVVTLGCQRILSSGGAASALDGSAMLSHLVAQAGTRVQMMAGAGLNAQNIATVAQQSGCRQLHASAKAVRTSAMRFQNPALIGLENDWSQTDAQRVAELRQALQNAA